MGDQITVSRTAEGAGAQVLGAQVPDRRFAGPTAGLSSAVQFDSVLRQAVGRVPQAPSRAAHWQALQFLKTGGVPNVRHQAGRDLFVRLRAWLRSAPVASPASPEEPGSGMTPFPLPAISAPLPPPAPSTPPIGFQPVSPGVGVQETDPIVSATQPMALTDYPHPPADNGRGMHWIPTLSSPPQVVDRFVQELEEMHMKWAVFLNDQASVGANDYLVRKLNEAGIMPILRVHTPGLAPVQGDLTTMTKHYLDLGVQYFQLYNEPNLMVETGGHQPDVDRYLDLWLPAAEEVSKAGGLPGFGALSPQGEADDRQFLREALRSVRGRGKLDVLNRAWLAMHNYTGPRPLADPDGFRRFEQYNQIMQEELGRALPIIGTEGGTHVSSYVSEDRQVEMVTGAYDYMRHRQPYNFAYTYWIIANEAGGGRDADFSRHALFRPDGNSPLVDALKAMA